MVGETDQLNDIRQRFLLFLGAVFLDRLWIDYRVAVPQTGSLELVVRQFQLVLQILQRCVGQWLSVVVVNHAQSLYLVLMLIAVLLKSRCHLLGLLLRESLGDELVFSRHQGFNEAGGKDKQILACLGMMGQRSHQPFAFKIRFVDTFVWR